MSDRNASEPAGKSRLLREIAAGLQWNLAHKISALVVAAALASGTVVAIADYRQAADELRRSGETRLLALMDARRVAIVDYLASIRRDLRSQAANPFVIEAFHGFRQGWEALGEEAAPRLRRLYVEQNPYPAPVRLALDSAADDSAYSRAHERYHPRLRDFLRQYGYRDLIFLDLQGRVIYSVMKQQDFATRPVPAPAGAVDGLEAAFSRVVAAPSPDAEAFVDFTRYAAAKGEPTGFLARRMIGGDGMPVGILVFEMPVDRINRVMNVSAGMGRTGETFIAGSDLRLRSDSRLSEETVILTRVVDIEPVRRALGGEKAVMTGKGAGGADGSGEIIAAFAPLDFLGTRWAIVAKADLAEVHAPVDRMRARAALNGLVLALLVAAFGYGLTRSLVADPISEVTGAVHRLIGGDRQAEIPSVDRADEIGDIARALLHFRDSLLERDRMAAEHEREAKAIEVRRSLTEAIEAFSDGFILIDPQDRIVLANSRYREFYARSAHLLEPGADFGSFLRHHAELGEILEAQGRVEEYLKDRQERFKPGETAESRLAGGQRLLIRDYRTEDGGRVSIATDITDLRRREQALVDSEERYRVLVDTLPDGVMLHDTRHMLFLNPVGRRILGLPEEGPIENFQYRDFVHPDERQTAEDRINAMLRTGADITPAERRIRTADGRDIWIEVSAVPFREGGEKLGLAVFRDLTETKQAQAEIERQREALHQSEKLSALGSLLAGVAHELNNPLSIAVAQAVLLEETNTDPKIIKRAKDIRSAAERCARIVKTFLSMAREQTPERGPVDLNETISNALELMGYTLRSNGIEVERNLGEGLPAIWGDGDQIHQVVANLIVNAQQAMVEAGTPRILSVATAFDAKAGMVTMTFDDSGPGIPENLRSRIFDPFYTTKPIGVGTGIGLAVCHGVIETHGGAIEVCDSPAGGARFKVRLPPSAVIDMVAEPQPRAAAGRAGQTVLVVDDEPEVAEALVEILKMSGHRADIAESGHSALERIATKDYDLILTDLRMPHMDGRDLYEILESEHPQLCNRMIVITGDTLQASARKFLAETGLPSIEKPFLPADVEQAMADALARAGAV